MGRRATEVFHVQHGPSPGLDGDHFYGEQRFRRKDGVVLQVAVSSVPLQGEEGSVTLFDALPGRSCRKGSSSALPTLMP